MTPDSVSRTLMPRWLVRRVRNVPIRWRILAIAVLNSALAVFLLVRIMDGAQVVRDAWSELRQVRQSERLLASLDSEAGRLQSLIHRYFNQPDASVLAEIIRRREALISSLRVQATIDPVVNQVSRELIGITERFVNGFDDLRAVRSAVSRTFEADVLRPIREMVRLHARLDVAMRGSDALGPALGKLRDAFNSMLLAANSYYLSSASEAGEEAKRNADEVQRTAAAMLALDLPDAQRETVTALQERAGALRKGLDLLSEQFAEQEALLRDAIDGNAAAMAASIDHVTEAIRQREGSAQERFDRVLSDLNMRILIVAAIFVLVVMLISVGVAKSIREPLQELGAAMRAIIGGDYARPVKGLTARDEIGEMARAVEIFRENAIAKRHAEEALRASKEEAEAALSELRTTQTSLIEAEKLAALGSLVAGVAHEVNNPVGISLTVASSLARRCEEFAREIETGPIRRSRLVEFVDGNRDAASQLVSNLHRAGELVQSFKQVAVDRSQADRRLFDLRESTDQIIASLRPGLKKAQVRLVLDVPAGIVMDSYPGVFGQVLTNLFLNSGYHAFPGDLTGTISIVARTSGSDQVHIIFRDDGIGMPEEVQRHAFDPFFTTRRGEGGTGLGLHIVYTLITRKLGGRIVLSSEPGKGTTFRISLPRVSPAEESGMPAVVSVEG